MGEKGLGYDHSSLGAAFSLSPSLCPLLIRKKWCKLWRRQKNMSDINEIQRGLRNLDSSSWNIFLLLRTDTGASSVLSART